MLGYLKGFPGYSVGYWSSGTGFAGLSASGSLLLLKAAGWSDTEINLAAIPTMIPYFLCFVWILKAAGWSDTDINIAAIPTMIPYFLCFVWINSKKNEYPFIPEKQIDVWAT
eukprot:CAMPEP_0176358968 /NCGR_PEP_ID=MMETSP0126-20121128/15963_1 /TAXON_ID=141414 ORGANISM="Strombidinopsis acuminatum, Strain SPMC142" /NCGR_SAMPLE_ID=MMETSP0126 /ASSEMBLY_ACC=CAM_ASM_000229 /LENGTH=111 /DNA_ID=CAMNT_0017713425 /DNA_START=244 /DNA_END=579 /DNA_ORIENTATION=-